MEEGEVFYFNKYKNAVQYRINSSEDLKLVINHFDSYPLCTQKKADYLLFKQAFFFICYLNFNFLSKKTFNYLNINVFLNLVKFIISINFI